MFSDVSQAVNCVSKSLQFLSVICAPTATFAGSILHDACTLCAFTLKNPSHYSTVSTNKTTRSFISPFAKNYDTGPQRLFRISLGPFYGAIVVPSVTRCRGCCCRCRCGHRFYIAIHQVSLLSHAACAIAIAGFGSLGGGVDSSDTW